jgi:hypothetical protein
MSFKDKIAKLDFDDPVTNEYLDALVHLRKNVAALQDRLNNGINPSRFAGVKGVYYSKTPIYVEPIPGIEGKMGRRWDVRLRVRELQDTLFTAYIGDHGKIYLDLYGEDLTECASNDELDDELINFIVSIKDRLITYRNYAGGYLPFDQWQS